MMAVCPKHSLLTLLLMINALSPPPDAVVGLERTLYSVTEGEDSAVEVCAVVFRPGMNVACPITFPFEVSLSTGDLSAGIYVLCLPLNTAVIIVLSPVAGMDYDAVINEILRFSACQRRQCVTIPILEDSVPEGVEYFNVTLERTPDLDPRITLNPVDGLIEIFDGLLMKNYLSTIFLLYQHNHSNMF